MVGLKRGFVKLQEHQYVIDVIARRIKIKRVSMLEEKKRKNNKNKMKRIKEENRSEE